MKITFIIETLALFVTFMIYDSKAEQDDNKQLRMLVSAPCVPSPTAICSTTATRSCKYYYTKDLTICSTKTVNLAQLLNNKKWSSNRDTSSAITSSVAGDQTANSCASQFTQVSCTSNATVMACTTNSTNCTNCTGTPVCMSTLTIYYIPINQPAQVVVPTVVAAPTVVAPPATITAPTLISPSASPLTTGPVPFISAPLTPVLATPVIATPVIMDPLMAQALKAQCSYAEILTSQQQTAKDAVCLITGPALTSKQQKKCNSATKKLISYQLKQAITCAQVPSD